LACGIPDLVLDGLGIDVGGFGGELDADGGFGVCAEGVVDESGEEVGFADPGISDHDNFEEEIKILLFGHV